MARIRQQFPQNYGSSGNINTEIENIIRYLNSAELGSNTIGELLAKLFDSTGAFIGPIELQKSTSGDIQYRVGTYANSADGWVTLVAASELRGEAGTNVGEIGAPIIHTRVDAVATSGQTVFDYAHVASDELLVYVNGVLKRSGSSYDYQTSTTAGTGSAGAVTFNSAVTTGHTVTIYKIRSTAITGFTRSDTVTTGSQAVFAFVHDATTKLQVYKNGILQREGGSFDYTTSVSNNTVTFNSAIASGNTISIITVENTSSQAVTGLMFESDFVNSSTGLINLAKVSIADGAIPQAKITDLVTTLGIKAKLTVSNSTPSNPATGDLWHDTSQTPNQLKFYDGTQFLRTSPESSLPTFTSSNAGQFVRVNGTGTALEYGTVDLSSVIAITQKGAANGVASLDSTGRMPSAQLPTFLSSDSFHQLVASVANTTLDMKRIYKQKIQIDGISVLTSSGSCSVQIQVNGTGQGSTYTANTTGLDTALSTPIQVDATSANKRVGFIVTNNSSAANLEVTLAISVLSS